MAKTVKFRETTRVGNAMYGQVPGHTNHTHVFTGHTWDQPARPGIDHARIQARFAALAGAPPRSPFAPPAETAGRQQEGAAPDYEVFDEVWGPPPGDGTSHYQIFDETHMWNRARGNSKTVDALRFYLDLVVREQHEADGRTVALATRAKDLPAPWEQPTGSENGTIWIAPLGTPFPPEFGFR